MKFGIDNNSFVLYCHIKVKGVQFNKNFYWIVDNNSFVLYFHLKLKGAQIFEIFIEI